ncbi:MAG: sugar transferase [Halanaerobiaceae bacterium]
MNKKSLMKLVYILGDIFFVNIAFATSFLIRFGELPENNFAAYTELIPYISLFTVIIFYLYNLYSNLFNREKSEMMYSIIPISIFIASFTAILSYYAYQFAFPRSVILMSIPVMFSFLIIWRYGMLFLEKRLVKSRRVIIIGGEIENTRLLDNINKRTNSNYEIVSIIIKEGDIYIKTDNENDEQNNNKKIYNSIEVLENDLRVMKPDLLFITPGLTEEEKKYLTYLSLEESWQMSLVPDLYEIMLSSAELQHIGELPIFEMNTMHTDSNEVIKRIVDISLSSILLIICFPLMLVTAIAIKLDSHGSIFFRQKRISKNGKTFEVFKFRTMVNNAEKKTGPVLASQNDNRITNLGNILRKTRIDEIPQLINVLKGDMSLIGPRPERPYFVNKFEDNIPEYKYRHKMKSGITGLAQVYGYYSTKPEDKLRMDFLYAHKTSFVFDLKIMLHTVKVMLMKDKSS